MIIRLLLLVPLLLAMLAAAAAQPAPAPPRPATIDALLQQRRWSDALRGCELAAERPGARDLARLLWQYGQALLHQDRAEDAAIMFMRQAILFPSAPETPSSLLETAAICHDRLRNDDAARRLLARAMDAAAVAGDDELRRRGETLRQAWSRRAEAPIATGR